MEPHSGIPEALLERLREMLGRLGRFGELAVENAHLVSEDCLRRVRRQGLLKFLGRIARALQILIDLSEFPVENRTSSPVRLSAPRRSQKALECLGRCR